METNLVIKKMLPEDWEHVKSIYLEGIARGHATFQQDAPSFEEWDCSHDTEGRLVARLNEVVVGWAALSPVSSRCVYAGVAEVSVYVGEYHEGKGVGRFLLESLIERSEQNGFWTLQSGIFPENKASLAIHKKCGFKEVGRLERIGKMNGVWRDTILLERRSQVVGLM
ncbi:N-acetyltransferase family protein [Alkalihalophilus lindianensis]|uniref:N-acetyltransferase family protein n=1 Tax=Alkalihalophilus lindianensis TaxID=1630542 RepID=A0ABU3XEY0_9BACI|nr:N-acetyltransferase family protein [Alkalihalophilus lindianensis]MDV2686446.1 N-acetyltransferase family protein [Alkalihalophilus lindianensis]